MNFFFRRWIKTIPAYLVALTCAAILFDSGSFLNYLRFASYTQIFFSDNSSQIFTMWRGRSLLKNGFILSFPLSFTLVNLANGISNKLHTVCIAAILIEFSSNYFMPSPEFWGEELRRSVIFELTHYVMAFWLLSGEK